MLGGIESVWEAVTNLPGLIVEGLKSFFENIVTWLSSIWNAITNLPTLILEGVKAIFVPDTEFIKTAFNSFIDELKFKFNIDYSVFESLFQAEQPVTDVNADYNLSGVGTFNLKFFDKTFFIQGVQYFRPFIRGFLVLMMLFYNIKQLIGFFGYNAGVVQGRDEWIDYNKTNTGGHKE